MVLCSVEAGSSSTSSTPVSTVTPQRRSGKLTPARATHVGVPGEMSWSNSAATKWPMNIQRASLDLSPSAGGLDHGHSCPRVPLHQYGSCAWANAQLRRVWLDVT